jgi:purine-binding chemotaxis protein CheW
MNEEKFVSFYLDDAMYVINIMIVREISRDMGILHVNQAPDFIRGLLNLRGQIATILDIGIRLGLEPRKIVSLSRCIILKTLSEQEDYLGDETSSRGTAEDAVGLLVDRVGDIIRISSDEIESPPANVIDGNMKYIGGVVKLRDEVMVIINTEGILSIAPSSLKTPPLLQPN